MFKKSAGEIFLRLADRHHKKRQFHGKDVHISQARLQGVTTGSCNIK